MNKEVIKSKLEFVFRAVELTSAQKAIINDVIMSIVDEISLQSSITNATIATAGIVKQAQTTSPVEEEAELSSVITTLNTLISNLKSAGIVANN